MRYISCIAFDRDNVERFVEQPLVEACRVLMDKNITTTLTSANQEDIERGSPAVIFIDYEALTEENRRMAQAVGRLIRDRGIARSVLVIPMSRESTIADVSEYAVTIAELFHQQPASARQ